MQDGDGGNIGRSADGRQVSAQSGAGEQAEIQHIGAAAHHGGDTGDHRQHGGHIGDVIDKGAHQHGAPDDQRIHDKQVVAAQLDEQLGDLVNDTRLAQAGNDHKQAAQKQQRFIVHFLQSGLYKPLSPVLHDGTEKSDDEDRHTNDAVDHGGGIGNEGRNDKQRHGGDQQIAGKIIIHRGQLPDLHGLPVFPEQKHDDRNGAGSTQLHCPENAGTAFHPEELQEIHVGVAAQHDGGGITHQGGGTLQVGGHRDTDQHGYRGHIQLFADGQTHRRDHENGGHIVHKGGHDARKQGHGHSHPHHIGRLFQHQIRQTVGHFGFDEQKYGAHGAGKHHENIPVDGACDPADRHDAQGHIQYGGDQRHIRPLVRQYDHQHIRDDEQDQCNGFHIRFPFQV